MESFCKKKPSCEVKSESFSLLEEFAVLKSFLVQYTSGCPLTCYNCQKLGHVAAHFPLKQCGYCRIENEHTSNKCPEGLAQIKPKVADSMFVELMAVESVPLHLSTQCRQAPLPGISHYYEGQKNVELLYTTGPKAHLHPGTNTYQST
ncbi:hypothetical protein DSO57_1036554 [Entomophthora muscae]|uniref:Uncharacterized protein n=1 Tax=Entomophthora muscae TaxID=34485 RepID=A0ACC2TA21_9FUNG|nr:hypothetical protein DSO57_1036554 [Entomophthora muscae]